MPNTQDSVFSTKGFYIGVAIFVFGLTLMIARVVLDLQAMQNKKSAEQATSSATINMQSLQDKLDEKIAIQESKNKVDFVESVPDDALQIFDHNPIKNPNGIITAIEFIDYGCPSCLVDANFAHSLFKANDNVKLVSKLNNTDDNKQLHVGNLASLVASNEGKYFKFREVQLSSASTDLNQTIENLEKAGVSLRNFRRQITQKPDVLLNQLALDIAQAQNLKVKSYTVFINNRMFSDDISSKYNLKDITVYLNNL